LGVFPELNQDKVTVHYPYKPDDPRCLGHLFSTNKLEFQEEHPKQADTVMTCDIVERDKVGPKRWSPIPRDSIKCTVIKPTVPFYMQPDYKRKKIVDGKSVYRTDIPRSEHPPMSSDRWNILVEIVDYIPFDRNRGCPIIHLKAAETSKLVTEQPGYKRKENGVYHLSAFNPETDTLPRITEDKNHAWGRLTKLDANTKPIHPRDEMRGGCVKDDRVENIETIDVQDEAARHKKTELEKIIGSVNHWAAVNKIDDLEYGYGPLGNAFHKANKGNLQSLSPTELKKDKMKELKRLYPAKWEENHRWSTD